VEEIRPLARTDGLLTEEVDGELLVYDGEREVACRLNGTAALVWRSSDGERTVGEVADEDMVMVALDTLAEHGLIQAGHEPREVNASRLSRRRFLRRVGVVGAAAISMPVVHSIVVPTPAAAASGGYTPYYTFASPRLFAR
jgi:hypothetical protein